MTRQTRTYSLHIERHGNRYLVVVPALEGCGAWATSYEQAVERAGKAVALHVESLEFDGRPIPIENSDIPVSLGVTVRTAIIS